MAEIPHQLGRFAIGVRSVGPGERCYIIAEVAQTHEGSFALAMSFIEAVSDAGADAVKFQMHIADAESTQDEPFRIPIGSDTSRYEYWRRMEFTVEQWRELRKRASEVGIEFLCSAFSIDAVKLLREIEIPAWKIGSGEFAYPDLLAAMARDGKPLIFSTGMSRMEEVDGFAKWCGAQRQPFALLQCTSQYPTPLQNVGLNMISEFRRSYGCPVGLSDHSGQVYPALAAIAQGADLIEVHVTFDRKMFGPDASSSLTFSELQSIVQARDTFYEMASHPVDKDAMASRLENMRSLFSRSVATRLDLPAGTQLTAEMLTAKKPGTGIPISELDKVIGKKVREAVKADRILEWSKLID